MAKLPSISETDTVYADDTKPYIFENPNDYPIETLVNHILPFPQEVAGESVKIPGTAETGFSEIYRNAATPNGIKSGLIQGLDTYHAIFENSAQVYADEPCLAFHEYDYENSQHLERYASISYKEVHERKNNLAAGLFFCYRPTRSKTIRWSRTARSIAIARIIKLIIATIYPLL